MKSFDRRFWLLRFRRSEGQPEGKGRSYPHIQPVPESVDQGVKLSSRTQKAKGSGGGLPRLRKGRYGHRLLRGFQIPLKAPFPGDLPFGKMDGHGHDRNQEQEPGIRDIRRAQSMGEGEE